MLRVLRVTLSASQKIPTNSIAAFSTKVKSTTFTKGGSKNSPDTNFAELLSKKELQEEARYIRQMEEDIAIERKREMKKKQEETHLEK
jgi:hypothetical protein